MAEIGDQPNRKSFLDISLSETLLVAIVPFLAYLFTFVYQAGYLKAFELPFQFVSVNTVDVFNVGSKFLGVFVFILGLINLFSSILPKGPIPYSLAKRLSQLVPILLFIFPFLFFYGWGGIQIFMVFLMIFTIMIMFFPPLVTRKYKGTYLQKMDRLDKEIADSNPWEGNLLDRIVNFIGHKAFVAILYFLLSINITYNAGKAAALNKEIFYIVNTSPDTVVLFMTNDRIISAQVNQATKLIEPKFMVINIGDTADLQLRLSYVGHLSLDTSPMTPTPTPTPIPTPTMTVTPLPTPMPTP